MAGLGPHCCAGFAPVAGSRAYSGCREQGLLWLWCEAFSLWLLLLLQSMWAQKLGLPTLEHMLSSWCTHSVVGAHGLRCSATVVSSWTRDRTYVFCIGRQTSHH